MTGDRRELMREIARLRGELGGDPGSMTRCPRCHAAADGGFVRCSACGAPLADPPAPHTGPLPRARYTATVEIEVSAPGTLEIEVSYLLDDARWKPLYDIRLVDGELEVTYLGQINQSTGEDWQGITLTLSTVYAEEHSWLIEPSIIQKAHQPFEPAVPRLVGAGPHPRQFGQAPNRPRQPRQPQRGEVGVLGRAPGRGHALDEREPRFVWWHRRRLLRRGWVTSPLSSGPSVPAPPRLFTKGGTASPPDT
jgi:hypothetical protein